MPLCTPQSRVPRPFRGPTGRDRPKGVRRAVAHGPPMVLGGCGGFHKFMGGIPFFIHKFNGLVGESEKVGTGNQEDVPI